MQPGQMAMMNQRGQMVPPGAGGLQPGMMPTAAGPGMMGPRPGMQYMGGPSPGGGGGMMPQVNLFISSRKGGNFCTFLLLISHCQN